MPNERFASGTRDRNKLLTVELSGTVDAEVDGRKLTLACRALSIGGATLEASEPLPIGTQLDLESLTVLDGAGGGDRSFELAVRAEVVAVSAGDAGQQRLDTEFIEMNGVARSNVKAAFSAAVAPLVANPNQASMAMRFNWAFRDAAQLAQVCRVLLAHVDLQDAWTDVGPSEAAHKSRESGSLELRPAQRSMLGAVWTLWSGSLEFVVTDPELPADARASLAALHKAVMRGPKGIEEWLAVERR